MTTQKMVLLRLFYNLSNRTFYIVIGGCLCPIKDKLCTAIQEREQVEIVHATDTKEIQMLCNESYNYKKETQHENQCIHY